ncbi:MAG: ribonuclease III domain-containing protein [Nannocystaceae bacterium]
MPEETGDVDGDDEAGRVDLEALEARLGYRFADPALLRVALTHPSWCNEHAALGWPSNQTLEFFGDAVLGLAAADAIWRRFPELAEGKLSTLRASVISERALARAARGIDLGAWLRLGRGDARGGLRERDAPLADAVEAVLGAAFLDARAAGRDPMAAAAAVVDALLGRAIRELRPDVGVDSKSLLQTWIQRIRRATPRYLTEEGDGGRPGAPMYRARVHIVGDDGAIELLGVGDGPSMRKAQQAAAAAAIADLRARGEIDP